MSFPFLYNVYPLYWKWKSRLTLCNPMDYTVYGILQARILEGVAFPFSSGSSSSRNPTRVSCIACGFFTSWATGKLINTVTLKIGHNDKKFENLVQMTVSPRARMLNRHSFTHSHSYKEKESKKYPEQYAHK